MVVIYLDLLNMDDYTFLEIFGFKLMLIIGMLVVLVLSFLICKKHGVSKLSTLLFILLGYSGGIYCAGLMGDLYTKISRMYGGGSSNVAIFGVVVGLPIVLILASLASGKNWRNITDLFAPGAFLGLAFSKFGCFVSGCCPGIECSFGIYNKGLQMVVFPSQLFESATMVIVVAFSFWYTLKYKKRVPGSAYPVTAIAYVSTRFFWEFLRYYDIDKMKHLFLGLSFWQLWCIVVFIVSLIWLKILKNQKLSEYEEKYYSFINSRYDALINNIKSKIPFINKAQETSVEETAE